MLLYGIGHVLSVLREFGFERLPGQEGIPYWLK